jgi:hypothetical protein
MQAALDMWGADNEKSHADYKDKVGQRLKDMETEIQSSIHNILKRVEHELATRGRKVRSVP